MLGIPAHVVGDGIIEAAFQQGAGGAGLADLPQGADAAFRAEGDLVRLLHDSFPGGVKACLEHRHAGTGQADARPHLPLPVDGEGGFSRLTDHVIGKVGGRLLHQPNPLPGQLPESFWGIFGL